MMRKIYFALLALCLLLNACMTRPDTTEHHAYSIHQDTIRLHSSELLAHSVRFTNASEAAVEREIVTAGSVQAIPTQFAYIAPPFGGRVTRSMVQIGQNVVYNQPLFEINSPDFTTLQKEYFQSKAMVELARKDQLRKEELLARGVCSAKEYEEVLGTLLLAEQEYENARAALSTYHVDPDKTVLGEPFVVRAPLAGNILENNIVTGQYIAADAEPVAVVANLSELWITAQVKEKDIRFIREGDAMTMNVDAYPGRTIHGTVYHVEEAVDEDTRSIRVLSICGNPDESLKIGMYTTVRFYGQPEEYTVVPEKAIMQGENDSYVLTELTSDCFLRRPVKVAFTREGQAYLTSGLTCDEKVVCEGGYYFQ